MADPTPALEITPGKETSEFSLAKLNHYVGITFTVLGIVGGALTELSSQFPNAKWLSVALLATGSILQLGTFLGYNKGRVALKMSLADAQRELSK